jgi:hypothetical protein
MPKIPMSKKIALIENMIRPMENSQDQDLQDLQDEQDVDNNEDNE